MAKKTDPVPVGGLDSDEIVELVEPMFNAAGWFFIANPDGSGTKAPMCPACIAKFGMDPTASAKYDEERQKAPDKPIILSKHQKDSKCPKCGNHGNADMQDDHGVRTVYRSGREVAIGLLVGCEHLERTCLRCGFIWPEATDDAVDVRPWWRRV